MAEVTIDYTARRKLTSGTSVGDPKTLTLELSEFNISVYDDVEQSEMIDGTTQESENFLFDRWSCSTINYTGDELAQLIEFLYSVRGGYNFVMTNPDEGDRLMENCKLVGRFSARREGRLIGNFRYSFVVQEF